MRLSFAFAFILLLGFSAAPKAFALTSSDISIVMTPENPAPLADVTISIDSYTTNLNNDTITWFVNGKNSLSGIGKRSLSLKAPNLGSETKVSIRVSASDGVAETSVTIRPSNMILLWQATDSYVPPFYKGKAMPSAGSSVKVVALPEIRSGASFINPLNMTYEWKLDYSSDMNGYGKNSFTYNNDYLENVNNVSVTATTTDNKYSAEGSVDIRAINPKIVFYKKDQTLGTLWENMIPNNHKIQGDEILEADPYFISPKNPTNPILSWSWTIDGAVISLDGVAKNLIPIKAQEGASGTAKLGVHIENRYKVFQDTSEDIDIQF